MANKLFLTNKKEGIIALAGIVTRLTEGKGSAEGRLVSVTLSGTRYDRAEKKDIPASATVEFWNSQDRDKQLENKAQYADRIKAAKVAPGAFLTVLAVVRENGTLSGLDFQYRGRLTIKGGKEYEKKDGTKAVTKDTNILSGSVTRAKLDQVRGVAHISIPTNGRDGETVFHDISIWNTEKNPTAAENAVKYLSPYESKTETNEDGSPKKIYRKAVFVCGENTHFGKPADFVDENGKPAGNSYRAFAWDFIPNAATDNKVPTEEAPVTEVLVPDGVSMTPEGDFSDFEDMDQLPWE